MPHLIARRFARWVLVWFALSIGAAIASPIVRPQAMKLVCSSAGAVNLVVKSDDGAGQQISAHTLECPLCMRLNAPPPPLAQPTVEPAQPLSKLRRSIPAAPVAAMTSAPPPARGLPFSL